MPIESNTSLLHAPRGELPSTIGSGEGEPPQELEKTTSAAEVAIRGPKNYSDKPNLQERASSGCFLPRKTLGDLMDSVDQSAINVLRNDSNNKKLNKSKMNLAICLKKNPKHLVNADLLSAACQDENIRQAVIFAAFSSPEAMPKAMKALFDTSKSQDRAESPSIEFLKQSLSDELAKNPKHFVNVDLLSTACDDEEIMKAVKSAALVNPQAMKALLNSPFFKGKLDGETDEKFASRCTQIQKFIDLTCPVEGSKNIDNESFSIALLANLVLPTKELGNYITGREYDYIKIYSDPNKLILHKKQCEQSKRYPHLKPLMAKATALMVSYVRVKESEKWNAIRNCLYNGIVPKTAILTFNATYNEKEAMKRLLIGFKENFTLKDEAYSKEIDDLIFTIKESKIIAKGCFGAAHEVQFSDGAAHEGSPPPQQKAVRKLFTNVTKITDPHHINQNHAELNILQALQPKQGEDTQESYFPKLLEASVVTTWDKPLEEGVLVSSAVSTKVDKVADAKFGEEAQTKEAQLKKVLTGALHAMESRGIKINAIKDSNILAHKTIEIRGDEEIESWEVQILRSTYLNVKLEQCERVNSITMQKCPGVPLSQIKAEELTKEKRNALASEINKAINAMHNRRIIHGDFHWDNILVHTTESGELQVKIIDFGCAKQIKSKTKLRNLKQEDKTRLLNCLVFNDPLRAKLQKLGWGSTHVELSRTQYTPNCPHASEDRTH